MRWLETIKVQAASGKESRAENELMALVRDVRKSPECPGLLEPVVYRLASFPGYFAIRLFWDTECPQIRGSVVGLSFAESLKAFGLVDHSVWIEMTKIQGGKENGQ